MKKGRNKYQRDARGELMLIHECVECKSLSINRIAADDDSEMVMTVFQESLTLGHQIHALYQEHGIVILHLDDKELVHTQLYGRYAEIPVFDWM